MPTFPEKNVVAHWHTDRHGPEKLQGWSALDLIPNANRNRTSGWRRKTTKETAQPQPQRQTNKQERKKETNKQTIDSFSEPTLPGNLVQPTNRKGSAATCPL